MRINPNNSSSVARLFTIEVVISSGGIDKLKKYQGLRTPEVWFWEDGLLKLYRWREEGYEKIENSEWLPEFDIQLLQKCLLMGEIAEAMRAFRRGMIL